MDEPEGGKLLAGRYRLDRRIGRGSMGSVWAGTDQKLRRPVAVKVMKERAALLQQALGRFEQEATAVARLRSPYVVQVYDYGVDGHCPFIVMELLEGQDLGELLKESTHPLSMPETTRIIVQTAKGLHAAHQAGIVHRDLKPANIFLVEEHGEPLAKVFDFGIAKALSGVGSDSEMTAEGMLLGTPRYMSPEQAHGAKHVDHRTDLWSLAVIAYQCVTGRHPFGGSGLGEIIASVCTEEPPPPRALNPYLPLEMDLFFEKALAKDPDKRFQTARDLGAAFARLTDASIPSLEMPLGGIPDVPCPALDSTDGSSSRPARQGELGTDGTLGAAAQTLGERLARRRRLGLMVGGGLGVVVIAALGLAIGLSAREPGIPGSAADAGATSSASAAADDGGAAASRPRSSGEAEAAEGSGSASALPSRGEPTSRGRASRAGRPSPASASASTSEPTAAKGAPPAAKKPPAGDGLDQFDNRF